LAAILYFSRLIFKPQQLSNAATVLMSIGFVLHTCYIVSRWYVSRRLPIVSLYETIVFFVWSMVLIYLFLEKVYKLKYLEISVSVLAALVLAYTSVLDKSIRPLMPALKSNWIFIHVISYFIGYAGCALSFILSICYLFVRRKEVSGGSLAWRLDDLSYRLIGFAFPFLTIGLTSGAVWAKVAWGSYWSWDPKETWALITWLIYATYLHLRIVRKWQALPCAYVSIIGFLCLLFTFLGVNYLLKGLHSYL
jgi:cytochrome c-type biogenesis protein CcsB